MTFDIAGKIALVTGGASGIGLACVQELLRNGLKGVAIADINEDLGKQALEEISAEFGPNKVIFIKTDVLDKSQFNNAFEKTVEVFKHLDILINNAGIGDEFNYEKLIGINFIATVYGTKAALDHYISKYKSGDEGLIVNMASITGLDAFAGIPVYTATKHAVVGFTRSYGAEEHYKNFKIRTVAICPGVTNTSLVRTPIKTPFEDIIKRETLENPIQEAEHVGRAVVKIAKEGKSGSIWVAEDSQEAYEVDFPLRQTRKKQ